MTATSQLPSLELTLDDLAVEVGTDEAPFGPSALGSAASAAPSNGYSASRHGSPIGICHRALRAQLRRMFGPDSSIWAP